ncbi:uncharacterized protein LOC123517428 isoform X1 [Portunus trituberculatus]|uniref:uncharacterized protein LOC123517428 isoform X1 n=1 Tax=Portunus trituberculatus TaxID=210409 RepID=UPI001E1CD7EA|nr:uncharacterized protein LOC123517428 isoform X1 [Portunus trituberculatus]XP_045133396.1 uncharacterized protein LOC123517428 isoform X1 [Portunus trituberculatus]
MRREARLWTCDQTRTWSFLKDEANEVRIQPQPAAPSPHLHLTTGQEHVPDQDEEHVYYEIQLDLSERRVVVPRPTRDSEEPVYDEVMAERSVWPHSALYENVPLPSGGASHHRLTEAQRLSESHIYDTVV